MAKVLLADDSATMQKVVDVVLKDEGFDVQSANTGEEALAAVGTYAPDLVFAYIKLPGMNGYDLTSQIKSSSNIPVILLAGAFEPVDATLMQQCGADDSLVKPFQTEDLLAIIRKFLPDSDPVVAEVEVEDDIVFDMSGGEDFEAKAETVTSGGGGGGDPFGGGGGMPSAAPVAPVEAAPVEAEVYEAEVVEAEVVEAEPVAPVEAAPVEAEVYEAEVVEAEVYEAEVVEEVAPVVAPPVAPPAPVAPAAVAPPVNMPGPDELSAIFMKTVEAKVVEALNAAEIKEAIVTLLEPRLNDALNNMLEETMPVLMQKILEDMVQGSLSMLNKELENIMWETVPELAETLIKKEIEKIKAS